MSSAFINYEVHSSSKQEFSIGFKRCFKHVPIQDAYSNSTDLRVQLKNNLPMGSISLLTYSNLNSEEITKLKAIALEFESIKNEHSFIGAVYFSLEASQPK